MGWHSISEHVDLTMITLVQAKAAHARAVAVELCKEDRHELALLGDSVEATFNCSEQCSAVLGDDGAVVALCGVSKFELGRVWMLRTPGLWGSRSHRRQIPAIAKTWLDGLPAPILFNWALASNTSNLRWLKSLGFQVEKPEPMGRSLALFSYFWRRQG